MLMAFIRQLPWLPIKSNWFYLYFVMYVIFILLSFTISFSGFYTGYVSQYYCEVNYYWVSLLLSIAVVFFKASFFFPPQDNLSFPLICPDWNADEEILLLEVFLYTVIFPTLILCKLSNGGSWWCPCLYAYCYDFGRYLLSFFLGGYKCSFLILTFKGSTKIK